MQDLAEIRTLLQRHVPASGTGEPLPGVWLRASTVPTEPHNSLCEPVLALVAQGRKRIVLNDRVLEYGAGEYLVVSVDLPIVGQVVAASEHEPYLGVAMALKPSAIAMLLLENAAPGSEPREPDGFVIGMASRDLLDPIERLLRLLDRRRDVAVLGPLIEREILWRLLSGEQGATVRAIGLADSRLSHVSRAIQWIRAHFSEVIRMEELADVASMGASTFYRHFRAVTAMSPLQFQKAIRLHEARARLIANERDVAAIAFEVGYESPSQFSREYSRLFGAPPSKDALRLRQPPLAGRGMA